MPNFYLLFGVIAVAAAILWASRQGGKPEGSSTGSDLQRQATDAGPPHPMAWIGFSLLGIGFLVAGMVAYAHPGEPSANAKAISLFMYLAYWLMGDYGPAIAFIGSGAACLYKAFALLRDD